MVLSEATHIDIDKKKRQTWHSHVDRHVDSRHGDRRERPMPIFCLYII